MQLKLPFVLVVAAVLLGIAGLVVWISLQPDAVGGVEAAPGAAQAPEASRLTPGVSSPDRPEAIPAGAPREAVPLAPGSGSEAGFQERESAEVRVVGRFVDGAGVPLSDAELSCQQPAARATSDKDGRFELALLMSARQLGRSIELDAALEGYARLELEPEIPERAGELDLGDVVLTATGSVSGRVVDEREQGVESARVLATALEPLGWGDRGSGPEDALVEVESGPDGRFLLSGLPEGEVRVWAAAEEHWWAHSDAVSVEGGRETSDIRLRLEALEPEDVIELMVVDPDHAPVAGASVHFFFRQAGSSGSGSLKTDSEGKYRRVLERRAHFDFIARDPDGRYRPAVARGIAPGTRDLVLVLGAPRELLVQVRDEAGDKVAGFSVSVVTGSRDQWIGGESKSSTDGEAVAVQLPTEAFRLTAKADGYESVSLGPLLPDDVGASVEVELRSLPGVAGHIVDMAGKPVPSAKITLHEAVSEGTRVTINDFPARSRRRPSGSTTGDDEGRFSLMPPKSGSFYLRVVQEGFAPGEIGPLEIAGRVGTRGLEVAIGEGGTIAGELLLPPGKSAAGVIVGISRADGFAVTGRTDTRGRFRFEGLTPGNWYVKRCTEEIQKGWKISSSGGGQKERELPWSCEVWAGHTTRFDLDLTQATRVALSGRLHFSGRPRPGWNVRLEEPGEEESGEESEVAADAVVDSQGGFRLELGEPGTYRLVFSGLTDSASTQLQSEVELALGLNEWQRDVLQGTLEGQVAVSALVDEGQLWIGWVDQGLRYSSFSNVEGDGTFKRRAPAGEVRVSYGELQAREVRVLVDGTTGVNLP